MPKKQKNAFYFFMKERQKRYIEEGKYISMKEIAEECHSLYKKLSPSERSRYEQIAKDYKSQAKDSVEGHLCSDGTVLALNNQAELERREMAENEMKAVRNMVFRNECIETIVDKNFYIICFNVLCRTDENDYIPNEVGIVRYSLRLGLEEHYHCFVDPGSIPLGYTHTSKQHSDDTHMIPISGFELAESNHKKIYKAILDFVNPTNEMAAPVFSLQNSLEQNRGCLQWLASRAGRLEGGPVCFYDIACLLMELRAYAGKAFPSKAIVVDMLSNNSFDYIPNTRCSYHEELDNAHCALGYAKRLCFILSDALCALYQVDCTPKHLPPRVNGNIQTETGQPVFPKSRLFIPPKLPMQYVNHSMVSDSEGDSASTVSSGTGHCQSWMKEFRQLQLDASTSGAQNDIKPVRCEEMRQPSTVPFVLSQALCQSRTQYALLGRGRGIGRGKLP